MIEERWERGDSTKVNVCIFWEFEQHSVATQEISSEHLRCWWSASIFFVYKSVDQLRFLSIARGRPVILSYYLPPLL